MTGHNELKFTRVNAGMPIPSFLAGKAVWMLKIGARMNYPQAEQRAIQAYLETDPGTTKDYIIKNFCRKYPPDYILEAPVLFVSWEDPPEFNKWGEVCP